jgi:hypothetical protein
MIVLPSKLTDFQFSATGTTLHCFTDGTAADPCNPEESLAAWSVADAVQGPLSWGPLPGIQQTVPRAEAFAVLSVMHWIVAFEGSVHLWVDNQGVVDHVRDILRGFQSIGR